MLDSSEWCRKCFGLQRELRSIPASATGLLCVLGQASLPLLASVLSSEISKRVLLPLFHRLARRVKHDHRPRGMCFDMSHLELGSGPGPAQGSGMMLTPESCPHHGHCPHPEDAGCGHRTPACTLQETTAAPHPFTPWRH